MRASSLLLVALLSATSLFAAQPLPTWSGVPFLAFASCHSPEDTGHPVFELLFSVEAFNDFLIVQNDRLLFAGIQGFDRMAIEDAEGRQLMLGVLDGRSDQLEVKVNQLDPGAYSAVFTGDFYHPTKVIPFFVSR